MAALLKIWRIRFRKRFQTGSGHVSWPSDRRVKLAVSAGGFGRSCATLAGWPFGECV